MGAQCRPVQVGSAADSARSRAQVATDDLVSAECDAANLRRLRFTSPLAVLLHALSAWTWRRAPAGTPEMRRWATTLGWLHLVMLLGSLAAVALVFGRRLPGPLGRMRRHLPTLAAMAYVVWGALVSANAQLVRPNLEVYTYLSLGVSVIMLVPTGYLVIAQGLAVLTLGVTLERTQGNLDLRRGQEINVLSVAAVGIMLGRVFYRNFRQQVSDRMTIEHQKASLEARQGQLEALNRELEARVEAKVAVALEQARELDRLHTRLQERVRERSRELSRALSTMSRERVDQALLRTGQVLGERVQIVRPLAAGGMGVVYEGLDLATREPVAVKVVPPSLIGDVESLQRFLREALAAASVAHPAVVRTLHVDVSPEGLLFQVQELLDGASLRQMLDGGRRFTASGAARAGAEVAGALAAAHAAGVVHRDIKPGNVMVTRRSPGLVLIDFGISRVQRDRVETLTQPGQVIGTPEYLSPEQVASPQDVGPASDIYSLGATLYRMLAGESAFGSLSPMQFMVAHVADAPRDLGERARGVPAELAGLVMACLRKAPAERPDASSLRERLTTIADALGETSMHALAGRWLDERHSADATRTSANLPVAAPTVRRSDMPPRPGTS